MPVEVRDEPAAADLRAALEEADGREMDDVLVGEDGDEENEIAIAPNAFVLVREYAHAVRPDRKPGDRRDFTETLYWHAGLRTDASTGQATFSFALNDSVTSFEVMADAFDPKGALGAASSTVESVEPFYVEPKLPLEVTSGDRILLPVGVVSGVTEPLTEVTLTATAAVGIRIAPVEVFALAASERARRVIEIKVGSLNETTDFVLEATAGPYADRVTRPLRVVPLGFPVELGFGGMVDKIEPAVHTVTIPDNVVASSVRTEAAVYPTPLANLTAALERLIQEPSGCFEQTSSTTYPLVMAQQYFLGHSGVDPRLIERSGALLDKGYQRLRGFECPEKGYEWFGQDPGHEALTAYGLLEFSDMSQVRAVDADMLSRTREWLLNARDGEGGFTRKRRALHTWIIDKDCSNGYILWALLESGERADNLAKEIAAYKEALSASRNSYAVALGANILSLAGDTAGAAELMRRLAEKQQSEGKVDGATTSIVGSGGQALDIETTSLAVLAWLRDPSFAGNVEKGIRYLADSCEAGRYGSTQSTVLALRAIVTYDKARSRPKTAGNVRIYVDGKPVGDPVAFTPETQGAIELPDVSELLVPGERRLELRMENGAEMPYSLAVRFHDTRPRTAPECKVDLAVALTNAEIEEGGLTEANVTVTNRADEPIPTPVAIIGLPGGLEPRHDQLKELVKKGAIAADEARGREVVLYWRSLERNETREISLSLVAAVPGDYTGPASRAYLYYTDEYKTWTEPLTVQIVPLSE